jgi:hypothetical protein
MLSWHFDCPPIALLNEITNALSEKALADSNSLP